MMPTREPESGRQIGVSGGTNSRWDAIWRLVLRAEELPAEEQRTFLQSAESDPFVIREAMAILNGSESLATAAPSFPGGPEERFVPQTGMKIGRYRVGTLLGSGGAGSVYAAFDEELNRPVAIKFVSARRRGTSASPASLWREARAASALNHPNIIMIHEVIETSDTTAIVMELVRGVTLRVAAQNNPPLDEVLRWSTQLAHSLAVAHDHGLVHGDIKPENVMVRDDGYIKLLDFGLALDAQTWEESTARFAGTPRYLAPERYLGQPRTKASDVFALGVVLYQLTTGRYPFEAENPLQLLPAITEEKAQRPLALRPDLPAALDELISTMLAKKPEARPTAQQVADKLAEVERHITTERIRRPSMRVWLALAAAVSLLAALVAVYWFRYPRGRIDFARMSVRPLASQPGLEDNPSISPDGFWISCLYRARAADRPKLQIHSTQGGPPVVIETSGLVVQGPAAWSPDSNELAFSATEGSRSHFIYRVSRIGGVPRRIVECRPRAESGCHLDWSPDGTALAIAEPLADRWPGAAELYLLDLSSGGRRALISPDSQYITKPRFSPDGRWVAYLREASMMSHDLYVVAAAGGQPRRITRRPWAHGFTWSTDGKSLVAISARLSNKPELWQFPLDGSDPYRVGDLDVTRGSAPSLSRGRGSLTWVRDLSANSLWRMPVDQSRVPELLVNSAAVDVDAEWSSNGRMVFRSDRSGVSELWIAGADGSGVRQATRFRGPFVGDPHWSPDGRSIAFTAHADGKPDIFVMRCEPDAPACSEPRQLTRTPASGANPTWSIDGRWIYFSSSRSGQFEVWRMPADGGAEPERITWNGGYMARESANGKFLYYSKLWEGKGFWRIALPARGPGQPETPIALDVPFRAGATWALGARGLFYYPSVEDPAVPFPAVRGVDVETGRTRDLSVGNIRLSRGLSLSPDGHWLLRSQPDRAQTLVMIAE